LTWDDILALKERFDSRKNEQPTRYPQVFFTFCMDQMESYVSFLLELVLSFGQRRRIVEKGSLQIQEFPPDAFGLLFHMLEYSDIQTLASGVFRPSGQEPTALFSRQWMSTLGVLRSRKGNDPAGEYFARLLPLELPWGPGKKHPTPVSGTWYLGILKGSIATEVGMRIIAQATSKADEVHKLNNYIGLPVRRAFYSGGDGGAIVPFSLPYREQYVRLADVQSRLMDNPRDKAGFVDTIMNGDYPFYRMLIKNYHLVAPVLWRLLTRLARIALNRGVRGATDAALLKKCFASADAELQVLVEDTR